MYPFKLNNVIVLGAVWIGDAGIVVVKNDVGEYKAYMKAIRDYRLYGDEKPTEKHDASYIARYGSSISLKAAKELGVYWNED